jgi:hypothetical protein
MPLFENISEINANENFLNFGKKKYSNFTIHVLTVFLKNVFRILFKNRSNVFRI